MHGATNQLRGRIDVLAGAGGELEMKENVALETSGKRKIKGAVRISVKQTARRVSHDSNNLDRCPCFVRLGFRRIVIRDLDLLSERAALRPEFICQRLVNDRHSWRSLVHGLGRIEGAPS